MPGTKEKIYRPTDKEPFMNERQREYFRERLLSWKEDILREAKETLQHLQDENQNHPDLADRASSETDRAIELRARDRQRKLIAKIEAALGRIDEGTYGYCEETGEPISLRRLEARPIATLSVEAQERHARRERVYRDEGSRILKDGSRASETHEGQKNEYGLRQGKPAGGRVMRTSCALRCWSCWMSPPSGTAPASGSAARAHCDRPCPSRRWMHPPTCRESSW